MFKNNFRGEKETVRITKDGHKDYRLKAETGYLGSKFQKDETEPKVNMAFNCFAEPKFLNWKIDLAVPGFGMFGIMNGEVWLGEEKIWSGKGILFLGMTHLRMPKSKAMQPGKKYKITISKWI